MRMCLNWADFAKNVSFKSYAAVHLPRRPLVGHILVWEWVHTPWAGWGLDTRLVNFDLLTWQYWLKPAYKSELWVSSGRIGPFEIASPLRCIASSEWQLEMAYLVVISYWDKPIQPSYTLCTQFKPLTGTAQGLLARLLTLTWLDNADYEQFIPLSCFVTALLTSEIACDCRYNMQWFKTIISLECINRTYHEQNLLNLIRCRGGWTHTCSDITCAVTYMYCPNYILHCIPAYN